METNKKIIVFYDGEIRHFPEYVASLIVDGYEIKIFDSDEKLEQLLVYIREHNNDIVLIVSEVVMENHDLKKTEIDCASLLINELDKIPETKSIKKIIFTSWEYLVDSTGKFNYLNDDKRFECILQKHQYMPKKFREKVEELLK